ncbi:MAG: divalent-cation tolerance protein CutA [Alphaproteobacteria bacterium]|jgi:periplasmic divalent cation tolerance protein|nr:divalent-cation tolerance protein CutA [Alphaproteobacteria bacterium]MDP6517299.1 divalent-cation tolerance protein CutA [Alphaproteobacteria bacterium]
MTEAVSVYITTADKAEALAIGRALVEKRLAACANVIDGMRSVYRWQGEVAEDDEAVLIVKTIQALAAAVIETVRGLHSYDCPCVVVLPILGGNPDYLTWIEEQTRTTDSG